MKKRVHRLQQTSQHSDSTQVTNQFQSRPFSVPTDRGKVSPDKQEMPSLQAQYERAKRFGHNVANISVFAHSTPSTPSSTGALIQPKPDRNAISSVNATQLSYPFVVQRSFMEPRFSADFNQVRVHTHSATVQLMSSEGTPKSNKAQNKQFAGAVREIETRIGRKLSKDERRQLHDAIHDHNYGFRDIVEEGVGMFGG